MAFDPLPALNSLRGFQRRTVDHVFNRLYHDTQPADRFLVADETGLGKSMVARGVIAKVIAELDQPDSGVERIDVVYVCSNADLAKQNLARLNVTGQPDIIESGRLTLLPGQLDLLQGEPAEGMNKRVNFISLTPGTSFKVTHATGQIPERAVLFALLEQLDVITAENRDHAVELLRATAGAGSFEWHLGRAKARNPGGFVPRIANEFSDLATQSGNLQALKRELFNDTADWDDQRKTMNGIIGGLRSDLARAGLNCLEPDLIILDEFQRFRDLLRPPAVDDQIDEANELARQFLEYDGAKLLLLSATPYKAHTTAGDVDGDDHSSDFLQLLDFLSRGEDGYLSALTADFETRRRQLTGQSVEEDVTDRIEESLLRFMSRTERPQLGGDDMLEVINMAPTKVKPGDLTSYRSLAEVSRATKSGNVLEYWKSIPYFAHFLSGYKIGRVTAQHSETLRPLLSSLATIDADKYRRYKPLDTDSAKFRAVRDHTVGEGWWRLLWIPPSLPYVEPSGPYTGHSAVTKQLVFTSWNAAPTALTTLLSYEAEREILEGSEHGENSPEARRRFRGRFRYAVKDGEPQRMSTLALFVPHVALSAAGDPLSAARSSGGRVTGEELREYAAATGQTITGPAVGDAGRLGSWASYFSVPGALPDRWAETGAAAQGFRDTADVIVRFSGAEDAAESSKNDDGGREDTAYLQHVERMLDIATAGFLGWDADVADLTANSPANCMYRSLQRIAPAGMEQSDIFRAALIGVSGLRSLFNRLDVAELLGQLYPEGEPWQRVLRYCEAGNLQSLLDEYVFQLRSQQPPGELTSAQLMLLANDIRGALTLRPAPMQAKYPDGSHDDLRMGVRFAVRYSNSRSEDGDSARMPEVRRSFNSPFWPFVLASTSVGQEGIDFHWWSHSVMHWNVPSNPVDFEQREGRVHRYLGHAVRKNVAQEHGVAVFTSRATSPWATVFDAAAASISAAPDNAATEFSPHWIHPGANKVERRLLDHPLSRDVARTKQMLSGLATYRLALGQARQDDLLGLIPDNSEVRALNLRPRAVTAEST
ncbi:hypothetical protein MUG94_03245 [Arthrobacter gengyunqii]|uniref:Helicase ATP-binding domain-containing protein n=1 Tax=Arthrobacter gengyunqii TaxID=2886940 RepID=A0A9X1M3V0_9MICC|nr:helicase-related protein [Arthrobacter gengyunqii]MCC3270097.1 hypothetical protein [Arthrobacter gengyunqii]UOY96805.1 hypothetical protein MUG94_03245 [Arthrobacter gengyunqii]